jgi:RimJ/RimL family protein N-acetyltransferase/SAM-dependent methyltransferase
MNHAVPGRDSTRLRPTEQGDCKTLFQWRNLPELIALSGSGRSVTWEEHCAWFSRLLDRDRHLSFIVEHHAQAAGQIRLDRIGTLARISIYLLTAYTGCRIGIPAIRAACEIAKCTWPDIEVIEALAQPANTRSLVAFERAGFERAGDVDGLARLQCVPAARDLKIEPSANRQAMIDHYTRLLIEHGISARALDWGSAKSQRRRFDVLAEIADLRAASVLDIGCGLGDFFAVLCERYMDTHYTGYDLTPAMIASATARFPHATFEVRDIVTDPPIDSFDYTFASGIFTFLEDEPVKHMQVLLRAMYTSARRGVAFNSLSTWASHRKSGEFFADPLETLAFCRTLTPYVVLRHDYFSHDFTLYMYREPVPI